MFSLFCATLSKGTHRRGVRCSTLSTANLPIRANLSHFILCRDWRICAGLADWHRLARIAEPHFKLPMQCQSANPMPILCQSRPHFGLAMSRQSEKVEVNPVQFKCQFHANRGSDPELFCITYTSIYCQAGPIHCRSCANPKLSGCQSMSGVSSNPIWCQSSQSCANLIPSMCRSSANSM